MEEEEGNDGEMMASGLNKLPREYDTYEEWLEKHPGADRSAGPEPAHPVLSPIYREWNLLEHGPKREAHPDHQDIVSGEFPIYGTRPDLTGQGMYPVHGVLQFDDMYPFSRHYGPDFNEPFDDNEKYQMTLGNLGYKIIDDIAKGSAAQPFDHQVWQIQNISTGQFYACKVVSVHYFHDNAPSPRTTSKIVAKMEKESDVLQELHHQNIISVFEVHKLRDETTGFPHIFVMTIMELMTGTLQALGNDYVEKGETRGFTFIPDLITDLLVQMIRALNYLQNETDYVIAHQAIRPANILYRQHTEDHMSRFKLADFEECIDYKRTDIKVNDFDRLKDVTHTPYITRFSSPEFRDGSRYDDAWPTLRTLPNDMYSIGASICWLINKVKRECRNVDQFIKVKLQPGRENWYEEPVPQFYDILQRMTDPNPENRATTKELMEDLEVDEWWRRYE